MGMDVDSRGERLAGHGVLLPDVSRRPIQLAGQMLGLPDAAILGASAGAPSSLQFALRHRDRCKALVLVVPAAYAPRRGGAAALTTPAATEALFETALRFDFVYWAATRLARWR